MTDTDRQERTPSVVILNTGDGKGKSSSAFGVMGRAWARGWRVGAVQFIKGEKWKTGEQKLADHLGVDWYTMGDGFTWESNDIDQTQAKAVEAWQRALAMMHSGDYDLLILDEVTYPVTFGWVSGDELASAIRQRPPNTNIVLTGRDAAQEMVDVADTVTEMVKIKHAYDRGIMAMKGIEY